MEVFGGVLELHTNRLTSGLVGLDLANPGICPQAIEDHSTRCTRREWRRTMGEKVRALDGQVERRDADGVLLCTPDSATGRPFKVAVHEDLAAADETPVHTHTCSFGQAAAILSDHAPAIGSVADLDRVIFWKPNSDLGSSVLARVDCQAVFIAERGAKSSIYGQDANV